MKLHFLFLVGSFCLFTPKTTIAQSPIASCGATYWQKQLLKDSAFLHQNQAYEQQILAFFQNKKGVSTEAKNVRTIPVVVHIIHDNGAENLSDAQVEQAIIWLNQTLSNQGVFNQGSGTDCGIQLCLAQRTPEQNPTNGVTRNQSPLTVMQMESQDIAVKNLNRWKPKDYVNIWVVRTICSDNYGCGVYGYSNYPFAHGSSIDGIVIEAAYLTEITKITGLAHEMGHFLGLYHTFEGGCSNNNCLVDGDRICDTPPDQSTSGVPCGNTVSTCATDTQSGPFSSDQPDPTVNFMDYGIIACFHDFTSDQSTRMNATLDGIRHSLVESKGCLEGCPAVPSAAFTSSANTIYTGQTVNFQNTSQNAASFSWTINGVVFSSQQNPSYTFNLPGTYTITLTAAPLDPVLCTPSVLSTTIQVICNITASFTLSDTLPDENEAIALINSSQNATQFEWFVDGVSQGNVLDTIRFPAEGYHIIKLVATNGACVAESSLEVLVLGYCEADNRLFQLELKDGGVGNLQGRGICVLEDQHLLSYNVQYEQTGLGSLRFVKLSPGGQLIWARMLADSTKNYASFGDIKPTHDGGFTFLFFSGNTELISHVGKFSAAGDLIWLHQFGPEYFIRDMAETPDGKITVCGTKFSSNEYQQVYTQFDANGLLLWSKAFQFGATGAGSSRLVAMPDGGFVSTHGDGLILRLSADGLVTWHFQLLDVYFSDVILLENGDIMACGTDTDFEKGIVMKFSENGAILQYNRYASQDFAVNFSGILQFNAQELLLVSQNEDLHAICIDSIGTIRWTRTYPELNGGSLIHASKFKDIGYVFEGMSTPVKTWVAKVDKFGRIGNCPFGSPALTVSEEAVFTITQSAVVVYPGPIPVPVTLPVLPAQVSAKFLCNLSCYSATEDCNNLVDDDGDGLFDCLDPDCNCNEDICAPQSGNFWYFGNNAGLNFNTDPPTILKNGKTINTTTTTVSDVNGNLLFYSDGINVYNRQHEPMANGVDKGFFAVPMPGDQSIYYLLGQSDAGVVYHTLDLKLDNGKGDVLPGNPVTLIPNSLGLMYWPTLTKTCEPEGYWLATRANYNNTFRAYHIGVNGIDPVPVISNVGLDTSTWGWVKFSPNGTRLVVSNGEAYKNGLEIFDFDPATGKVSNAQFIAIPGSIFLIPLGMEFSPSGRFVYLSTLDLSQPQETQLYQFDLKKPDESPYLISASNPLITDLKLAPNGKIYGSLGGTLNFSVMDIIHHPNEKYDGCTYEPGGLIFPAPFSAYYLPFTPSYDYYFPSASIKANGADTICAYQNLEFQYEAELPSCGVDQVEWKLEGISGQISATGSKTRVSFTAPGSGRLIVAAQTTCGLATDTLDILIVGPLNKTIDLGPDQVVCQNGVFTFNAGSGFVRYLWSDGTTDSTTTTLFPGTYWVKAWDLCGNLKTDTVTISIAPGSLLDLGPDLPEQCAGFSFTYSKPEGFTAWKWSPDSYLNCDDCQEVTISPAQTASWIVVAQTAEGCVSIDTLQAIIRDTLFFELDTSVCAGDRLAIFGTELPADTSAQFFRPSDGPGCDSLLNVHVLGLESAASTFTVTICANATFEYQGISLPADTIALFQWPGAMGCDSTVTVAVKSYPALSLILPIDTSIHIGASVLLEALWTAGGSPDFSWSPTDALSCTSCPAPLASPLSTLTYTLSMTDSHGCTLQDSVMVRVNSECRVRIPTAFTPNGDGANDRFAPILDPCVKMVRLWRILNRWGQIVFEQFNIAPNDPILGWDGTMNGAAQPSDVLIWMAEFEYYDGHRDTKSDQITLIR